MDVIGVSYENIYAFILGIRLSRDDEYHNMRLWMDDFIGQVRVL